MGGPNRLDFSVGDRNALDIGVGIEIELVLCGGPK